MKSLGYKFHKFHGSHDFGCDTSYGSNLLPTALQI